VEDEFVGAVALASAQSPRNRRSHARAHPAVGGLQNEHHKRKSERGAGEGVGADATKEEAVEDDDANEREQIQYVRCCEPQQRRKNRALQQQFRSCCRSRFRGGWSRQ
jgi:hypothetical protein